MGTLIFYPLISKKEVEKSRKTAIEGITKWFMNNPKRKVCNAEWVYGEVFKVKRNNIEEVVNKMAKETKTK